MNKYQEALDNITETNDADERIKYRLTLQELVDKATPKKPIQTVFNAFCPNCKEALGKQFAIDGINGIMCRQYCSNCGQALDWSEDN